MSSNYCNEAIHRRFAYLRSKSTVRDFATLNITPYIHRYIRIERNYELRFYFPYGHGARQSKEKAIQMYT